MPIEHIDNSEQLQYSMSFYHENGTVFDICPGINIYNEPLADVAHQDLIDYLMAWDKIDTTNPIQAVKTKSEGYQITAAPPEEPEP